MALSTYFKRTSIQAPVEALFAYHENKGAFKRLNPPWQPVQVVLDDGHIRDGARVELKMKLGPIPQNFRLVHQGYQPNEQFQDVQVTGPFAHWVHTHRMLPDGQHSSILEDRIEYKLPLGLLGKVFGGSFAHATLERMFAYRHEITQRDLAAHQAYQDRPPLTVAVTGASGLIGSQLVPFLSTGGHQVKRLVRSSDQLNAPDALYWNPATGTLNAEDFSGIDAVIHLAGETAGKRWTPARKQRILESRLQGTRLLAERLASLPVEQRPQVLVAASAVGYYGNRGAEVLTETSPAGEGFRAEVCRAWEEALQPALEAGLRVVILRLGTVLAQNGGALGQMLLPYQMGMGGKWGHGQQMISWIALDDVLGVIHHALMNTTIEGVYNVAAPAPVTNQEFTQTLGRVLHRPTLLPLPGAVLRLLWGELAEEVMLGSTGVSVAKLLQAGYHFRYPTLESALRHVLGRVQ